MRRPRFVIYLAALFFLAGLIAACGDNGAAETTTEEEEAATTTEATETTLATETTQPAEETTTTLAPVDPLIISIGSANTLYGAVMVALANDLFVEHGVEVNVESFTALSTGTSQLVGGQIDLLATGATQGSQVALQGRPVSIVYETAEYTGWQTALFAASEVESMDDLVALGADCTLAIEPPGTSFRAWGKAVVKAYGLECSFIESASPPAALAAVVGGSADAAVVAYNPGLAAAREGQGNLVIDPTTLSEADAERIVPVTYPAITVMGLTETIAEKNEAVQRFVRALAQAQELMQNTSSEQLAEWSLEIEGEPFGTAQVSDLAAAWDAARLNFPSEEAGFITEAEWESALTGYAEDWELPNFDSADASVQYDAIIDMSFLSVAKSG